MFGCCVTVFDWNRRLKWIFWQAKWKIFEFLRYWISWGQFWRSKRAFQLKVPQLQSHSWSTSSSIVWMKQNIDLFHAFCAHIKTQQDFLSLIRWQQSSPWKLHKRLHTQKGKPHIKDALWPWFIQLHLRRFFKFNKMQRRSKNKIYLPDLLPLTLTGDTVSVPNTIYLFDTIKEDFLKIFSPFHCTWNFIMRYITRNLY